MQMSNQQKIEEILNSLDGCGPATPAPYLLTRVMAKMAGSSEVQNVWSKLLNVITQPTIALGGLILIVMLNVFVYISYDDSNNLNTATAIKTSAANEDFVGSMTSIYEVENIEP